MKTFTLVLSVLFCALGLSACVVVPAEPAGYGRHAGHYHHDRQYRDDRGDRRDYGDRGYGYYRGR